MLECVNFNSNEIFKDSNAHYLFNKQYTWVLEVFGEY